ncbi:MAG TPA: TonB-dependent receptor [Vicinamibacteria bacterium]
MSRTGLYLLAVAVMAFPAVARGQARMTGADVRGTVRDQTGGAMPGVTVTATNLETNVARTAVSDGEGRFTIPALPPGRYRVGAEISGFVPQAREVPLALGQLADLDFSLRVAGGQEEVVVTAEAPVVDPTHTAVSTVVGQQQIENLPINGRNFISFSVITPGVSTDRTPEQGAAATSGLSFTGQRARSNNIMVDGLDNNDLVVGSVRATFSQEAIREFQVLTNSYSAEFGKASGGIVNIVTKSGTNELHGNAFLFFRDESLNARAHFEKSDVFGNPIDRPKAPYSQKQWGATLGGPLHKDRTFFFLSFERNDSTASNFVNIDPTAAAILRTAGFPVELGNVPYDFRSTELLGKVDHQWRPNHSLVLRANWSDTTNENVEPFGGIVARSRGAVQLRTDWSLAASETDILGPHWVSEARLQWGHQHQDINSLDPNCGGPCGSDESKGGPTLEVTGVASVGRQRFTPQPRTNDRFQATETLSFLRGDHSAKAGLDFNWIDNRNTRLPLAVGGRYIFSALPAIPGLLPTPITAIQAVALGLPAAYVKGYGNSGSDYGYKDVSLFVQDDWRINSRLTLKPGLRYQKQFWDKASYTVSNVGGTTFSYDFPSDNNDIAPRLAVAWDPKGDGKTSVHAAYGLFYDNQISGVSAITRIIDGRNGIRTLVAIFPSSLAAWNAPGHNLPEPATPYPSLVISIDPAMKTPYAHQAAAGVDRQLGRDLSIAVNGLWVRGKNQLGSIDYNPTVSALGPGRRPNDVGGRAGTSATVLQYTSFGETWYKGLTLSVNKRFATRSQLLASYTLSKAEDTSTDFQGASVVQDQGVGRNPADPTGLPLGFDASRERGPATHDQRHRFVLSGFYRFPLDIQLSTIVTAASGRPFNPLAGADLNGDGNGGAFPPDRARRNPADPGTSVGRNSGTMKGQFNVDARLSKRFGMGRRANLEAIVEAFNLFDRTNFSEINNVFGVGAFPDNPQRDSQGRVTYGLYQQALPPREVQLAVKVAF